jgi:5-hydroxyisourate hydrolase-like protein (transthyretin family)
MARSEGKKDILLLINPDGEIDEKSNRNNLLSKTLIVRPAEKTGKRKKTATAPEKSSSPTDRANLVVYIETISGVHYTSDGQVSFYITNNSQTTQSKPFTLGVQLLQASQSNLWLIRQPVKALKAGETVTISTRWPEDQLSTTSLFLAMVDIEGKIEETDVRDNHTRPFRVVSTATNSSMQLAPEPEPEIIITRPAKNGHLPDSNKLVVSWETHGDIGNRVRISVSNSKTKEKILSSITNNDGQFSVDFSSQKTGEYTLLISTENNDVTSGKRTFQISRKEPVKIPMLLAPVSGASFRGEQLMKIIWPDSFKKRSGLLLNFVLLESSSKKIVKLNDKPVAASDGQFTWQVPDDGTVFGIYRLQLSSIDGNVLAETTGIELLPNFVSFKKTLTGQGKKEIQTDLEIARTNFSGQNLEFLVMNNGPADISVSGMLGYKFTSYFVRKLPITSDEDLVICQSSLLAELPQGEGQVISLGRDPDCPLGERGSGASFEYVVNRFVLPVLVDYHLTDPKPLNNLSKFYWPE